MSKQTGPKTLEGKARSSQNALKHGLATDRMFVLANENQAAWDEILNIWTVKLQPRDDAETMIVQDIAHAQWKIRRARTIETGLIDHEMEEQFDTIAAAYKPPIDEGIRMARAFKGSATIPAASKTSTATKSAPAAPSNPDSPLSNSFAGSAPCPMRSPSSPNRPRNPARNEKIPPSRPPSRDSSNRKRQPLNNLP